MKILNCQISPIVGDIRGNFEKIRSLYADHADDKIDVFVFPELSTSGYLAKDLLLKPSFINEIHQHIDELTAFTDKACILLPTPYKQDGRLYNAVLALQNGKVIGKTFKHNLPNYGLFDEKRYFTSGTPEIIEINGTKIGVPICEDIWFKNVCKELALAGAVLFLAPNGSPFDREKKAVRLEVVTARYREHKIPLLYCNQVIGHDGVVFDGSSFAYDGRLHRFAPGFEESVDLIEFEKGKFGSAQAGEESSEISDIYNAMVRGTRDYVQQSGFSKVLLGLSGGIDSAVVACISADALGRRNVLGVMLPSKYSSDESKEDAVQLANKLGIELRELSITSSVEALAGELGLGDPWQSTSLTIQNLQSRVRGVMLMALSNETGALLMTTGNKSEYATGYATIYGDMNGAFNPIKDIYKTDVYRLAEYRNIVGDVIPKRIITKEPSAELAPDQRDSDSLPDYEVLDEILEMYIEKDLCTEEIARIHNEETVQKVVKLVNISEFKRQQSAPGVKISTRSFNLERRYPISNRY